MQRDTLTTFVHLWGARRDCAYGLSDGELFHFDGSAWMHVDLAAAEIPGLWAHGASGADGTSWVVGTYATHSCMARPGDGVGKGRLQFLVPVSRPYRPGDRRDRRGRWPLAACR